MGETNAQRLPKKVRRMVCETDMLSLSGKEFGMMFGMNSWSSLGKEFEMVDQ